MSDPLPTNDVNENSGPTLPTAASWVAEPEHDQTLEENWLFRLRRERFRSRATGKAHDYYVLRLADVVNVVALTTDRQVILVRQFRAGSRHDSLETPGGLIDPGEDPCVAGARELREETGYEGDPTRVLGTVWTNPSILSSKATTILISNARLVATPELDHSEEVAVELVPAEQVPALIRDGKVDHSLAVCGLLWWLASELPGPLSLESPKRRWRLGLGAMLAAVAVVALVLWLLGREIHVGLFVASAVLGWLTFHTLDLEPRATLWRTASSSFRGVVRLLTLGLGLLTLWGGLLTIVFLMVDWLLIALGVRPIFWPRL